MQKEEGKLESPVMFLEAGLSTTSGGAGLWGLTALVGAGIPQQDPCPVSEGQDPLFPIRPSSPPHPEKPPDVHFSLRKPGSPGYAFLTFLAPSPGTCSNPGGRNTGLSASRQLSPLGAAAGSLETVRSAGSAYQGPDLLFVPRGRPPCSGGLPLFQKWPQVQRHIYF